MACQGCNGGKAPAIVLPNVQANGGTTVVSKSLAVNGAPCPCNKRDWYDWVILAAVVIGALYALDRMK